MAAQTLKRWWNMLVEWWIQLTNRVHYVVAGESLPAAAAVKPVPKEFHQTAADKLNWLCYRYKGTYRILRLADGVVVLFTHRDGHTVTSSGLATSTARAVGMLEEKVEKLNG